MLAIGRKKEETIYIGPDVMIKVCKVGKGRVTLGIEAPKDMLVLRGELAPNGIKDGQDRIKLKPDPSTNLCHPQKDRLPHSPPNTTTGAKAMPL